MEKTESQMDIACHQMKLSIPGYGYIELKCLPILEYWNPETIKDVSKTINYSPNWWQGHIWWIHQLYNS